MLEVTVPPAVGRVTVAGKLKVAWTASVPFTSTVQLAPDVVSQPVHEAKEPPALGTAFKVTLVPLLKFSLQSAPQEMPAGVEVTVPPPPPVRVTVIGKAKVTF